MSDVVAVDEPASIIVQMSNVFQVGTTQHFFGYIGLSQSHIVHDSTDGAAYSVDDSKLIVIFVARSFVCIGLFAKSEAHRIIFIGVIKNELFFAGRGVKESLATIAFEGPVVAVKDHMLHQTAA